MGWKGYTNAKDRIFGEIADRVIRLVTCNLMVVKLTDEIKFEKCLLPTSGGPNAKLASEILDAIAKETEIKVTAGYIIPEEANDLQKSSGRLRIDETLKGMQTQFVYEKKLIASKSIAGGIAKTSKNFDLVIIGAAKEPFFRKMLFGEIPEKVARFSPTSVVMVKKYEGVVKSLLKRVLG
jgi:nucleotide-binding universal stress UspA family protein